MRVEFTGLGHRTGMSTLLVAVCIGWLVGGCGFADPVRDTGSARNRPDPGRESPPTSPSSVRYRIPRPAEACEAVRASGVAWSSVTQGHAVEYRTSCTVELGTDPKRHPHTLAVRYSYETNPGRAAATYNRMKDADWNWAHSPFSGRAAQRQEVGGRQRAAGVRPARG
jgi:hypothetical protein